MRVKLGIPMTVGEIAQATDGRMNTASSKAVSYIVTDSREAREGDLFIAIRGSRFDGERFVKEAATKGALTLSTVLETADILVDNTADALLSLGRYYSKKLPYLLYKIAITGSVGKTTTKEFLNCLASQAYRTHATVGNLNNHIGLPLSLLSAPKQTQVLIMEMGMNHRGEIKRLSECLNPDIAIITNIGTAHIGNLGSRENIALAKLEILSGMTDGRLLIPRDEPLLRNTKGRSFSLTDPRAYYYLNSNGKNRVSFFKDGRHYLDSDFRFSEEHLRKCLAAACSAAAEISIAPDKMINGIMSIFDDNIRQKLLYIPPFYFLADFYNASYESVTASFESAKNTDIEGEKCLLLGDVLELGEQSEAIHRRIGESIPYPLFSKIFLFGKYSPYVLEGARSRGFPEEQIFINCDCERPHITAEQIRRSLDPGSLILMKASRGMRLERILDFFR